MGHLVRARRVSQDPDLGRGTVYGGWCVADARGVEWGSPTAAAVVEVLMLPAETAGDALARFDRVIAQASARGILIPWTPAGLDYMNGALERLGNEPGAGEVGPS